MFRHMLEIQADSRPRPESPAHAIDEHIGGLKVRGRIGMSRLPALQACERVFLVPRATDFHEWTGWLTTFRWLDPSGLAGLFAIVWRPWSIAQAIAFLLCR